MKTFTTVLLLAYVSLICNEIYASTNNNEISENQEYPTEMDIDSVLMKIKTRHDDSVIKRYVDIIIKSKDDNAIKSLLAYSKTLQIGDDATRRIKSHILNATETNLFGNTRQYVLMEIFSAEIDGLRYAESKHAGRYYPQEVWMRTIDMLTVDAFPKAMRATLDSLSRDTSLPFSARYVFLASVMRYDNENNGFSFAQNIQRIIANIPAKPEAYIPWGIYNVQNERVNYFSKKQLRDCERWNELYTGGLLYDASLYLLRCYRFESINQILEFLKMDAHLEGQRDLLVMVAAQILSPLEVRDGETELVNNSIIPSLIFYINKMEDKGAWCYRNYAIRYLNTFFNHNNIRNPQIFREGGNVLSTIARGGADAPPDTNALFVSSNITTNSISKGIFPKIFLKYAHKIKWLMVSMVFLLALWVFSRIRKK